ncbi:MAG: RNA 3'-terminal phosphate cyclase [Methanomicrobiales archaeon]|nr:RNA 3'-terminal phosphate cyclase [Methanomicrobiales archaeon]
MKVIDGSRLEGGGQLVRMAVALSALTAIPVEIRGVRAGRKKPGLAAQHIAAVKAVAGVCSAKCTGLAVGSSRITFSPGEPTRRDIRVDVGTAGSIPLVLQAYLPVALRCGGSVVVNGGTDVEHAPTIDYFQEVHAAVLRNLGAACTVEIRRRGYYPQGGGEVAVEVAPSRLRPLDLSAGTTPRTCGIVSCSSGLPAHVAERQARAAGTVIRGETDIPCTARCERQDGHSTGSSCTVWSGPRGACALGRRGFPAEKVGEAAARGLVEAIQSGAEVDRHLSDQLLVYLALAGGSFTAPAPTLHVRTMHWLLAEFGYDVRCREGRIVEWSA